MPYVLVFLIAAAAGGGVAVATLRRGDVAESKPANVDEGLRGPEDVAARAKPRATGQPRKPLPSTPTAQTRVTGVVGLLIVVLVGGRRDRGRLSRDVVDALRSVWRPVGSSRPPV